MKLHTEVILATLRHLFVLTISCMLIPCVMLPVNSELASFLYSLGLFLSSSLGCLTEP